MACAARPADFTPAQMPQWADPPADVPADTDAALPDRLANLAAIEREAIGDSAALLGTAAPPYAY